MRKTFFGQERKCRDVAMVLVFLASWGFSLWVGYTGLQHGDPMRLVRPSPSRHNDRPTELHTIRCS